MKERALTAKGGAVGCQSERESERVEDSEMLTIGLPYCYRIIRLVTVMCDIC